MDKRKVRKRTRQIFSLVLVLLVALGGYKFYENKKFKDSVNELYAAKIKPDGLQEIDGVKVNSFIEIDKNYLIANHIPKVDSKKINGEVDELVNNYVEQFKEKAGKEKVKDVKKLPNIYTNYEVHKYGPDILGIKLNIREDNLKEAINEDIVLSYDTLSEKKVELGDLFIEESKLFLSKKVLNNFIENNIEINEDFKARLAEGDVDFNKFLFTEDSIDLYFKDELLEDSVEVVSIPYSQMEAYAKYDLETFEQLSEEEIEEKVLFAQGKGGIRPGLDPNKPMVALTFDDGPFDKVTIPILDTLEANGGAGTFFVLGNRVGGNEHILKRMVENGHEIGNHSFDHSNLSTISADQVRSQIDRTQNAVKEAAGVEPRLLRPTYGAISKTLETTANMPLMLWSVDTLDWKHRDANRVANEIINKAKDGDIVLMHDLYPTTAEGVKKAIPVLKEKGFQFVTLSEMYQLKEVELEANKRYLYID